jgi:hypothetical protein
MITVVAGWSGSLRTVAFLIARTFFALLLMSQPRTIARGHAIPSDGDGYTRFPIVLLNAYNLSPALEANGVVRMEVLEYQGKLDRISGGK